MQINKKIDKKGFALVIVLVFIGIFLIMTIGVIGLVSNEISLTKQQIDSTKAFFLSEAGVARAIASVRDAGNDSTVPSNFSLSNVVSIDDADLDNVNINITSSNLGGNMYQITATSTVENSTRSITANLMYNPASQVFDYAYFLNNWGWFFGAGITARGDIRSNGRFDFQSGPTVEGEVYAGQEIGGGDTVRGKAGTQVDGEFIYQHPNSPKVEMPNLQNLSYYESIATSTNSTIIQGGATLVTGIYGDDAGETGNMVLIGTADNPIEVDGAVVIRGDVVIRGVVAGQGTIYSGRNLYIAGNIEYNNGPSTPRPDSDDPSDVNQWVSDNEDRDVVGFAATENIVMGDYTNTGWPYSWSWLTDSYFFQMGSEDVGEDGIPDTDDTGEDDGTFQSSYEDLDGDGVFDDNYNWSDLQTQTDISNFSNLPPGITSYNQIATNEITEINGILYTNHGIVGWGNGIEFNGALVSKDESIAAYNSIDLNYDERLHSRYGFDPNWLIDLNLPVFEGVTVEGWWE